ncbi:MAG: hypothetical protein J5882_08250 [Bacteroidales bacterium]|nr:hypothetical protein [Bacteroidales bacterium]
MRKLAHNTATIVSAILMAVLVLCVPVVKQYHPAEHQCCHNEGGQHHCDCPVCCFQLSTIFLQDSQHSEVIVPVEQSVYVPLTLQGYGQTYFSSIIIRGPPRN